MKKKDIKEVGYDSNIVTDSNLKYGGLRLLESKPLLVLPAKFNIRALITSTDVLHS